jgi:peroxiredoxin Q/BCP
MRKPVSAIVAAVIGSTAMFGAAHAADVELKVGDKAPIFTAKDDTGKEFKSTDVVGKKFVVVYFYPADLTGGCTAQACGFRDDLPKLTEKDVLILGVSGDSVENHQIFKKEKELTFPLLADEDGAVAKAFGVPLKPGDVATVKAGGKEIKLKQGVRAARWTFLIDKEGKIALKNQMVKAADDSKAILKKVEELSK